jgi:two-component system, OmpR family, phosphate regulon sensor histidine kinase PhoR
MLSSLTVPLLPAWILVLILLFASGGFAWQRARFHERLERHRQRWARERAALRTDNDARLAVLEHLPFPLLMLDEQLHVLRLNQAARARWYEAVVGSPLSRLLWAPAVLRAASQTLETGIVQSVEDEQHQDGQEHTFRITLVPLPVAATFRTRLVVMLHDTTLVERTRKANADFVANASHELRTPLTTIVGFLEALQSGAKENPATRDHFLGILQQEAQRMRRLVEALLQLANADRTERPLTMVPVALETLIPPRLAALQARAKEGGLAIHETLAGAVWVKGDAAMLEQAIQNILENAVKYAAPQTTVRVRLDKTATTAIFTVENQGEGIHPTDLPRLTERFYCTASARARREGTGLGLAIVKHILRQHDGTLTVESVLGESVTVRVEWPLLVVSSEEALEKSGGVPPNN